MTAGFQPHALVTDAHQQAISGHTCALVVVAGTQQKERDAAGQECKAGACGAPLHCRQAGHTHIGAHTKRETLAAAAAAAVAPRQQQQLVARPLGVTRDATDKRQQATGGAHTQARLGTTQPLASTISPTPTTPTIQVACKPQRQHASCSSCLSTHVCPPKSTHPPFTHRCTHGNQITPRTQPQHKPQAPPSTSCMPPPSQPVRQQRCGVVVAGRHHLEDQCHTCCRNKHSDAATHQHRRKHRNPVLLTVQLIVT